MAIPTYLLTGFLGSGKTTLLNRLLADRKAAKSAVVENEYGAESIDASLVSGSTDLSLDLSSGCLCHDLAFEFLELLGGLVQREREEGLDVLFIESSGVSDPALIADPFERVELIKRHFELKAIVTVVNPETIEDDIEQSELARQQLSAADILFIARSGNVSPLYLQGLREGLFQTLSPFAKLLYDTDRLPEKHILQYSRKSQQVLEPLPKAHNDIKSVTLKLNGAFDKGKLFGLLNILLLVQGQAFYRIKGWVWLEGEKRPKLLNALRQSFVLEEAPPQVVDTLNPMENTLVLIGKSLDKKRMEQKFTQCLAKP